MGLTPGKGPAGFEPHDVKLTFNNKYGRLSRFKAGLLVAMLNQAGFDPFRFVSRMKRDKRSPSLPSTHRDRGRRIEKGEHILMDPTAEKRRSCSPPMDEDQSYLLCKPNGDTLRNQSIVAAEDNPDAHQTTAH